ncbi:MAG TPA: hypothetical protein VGG19_16445 [Tepidisphaeraceae bacterium]|jgi:hypothetical protein
MRSFLSLFGGTGGRAMEQQGAIAELRITQYVLKRVLECTGHTIDQVINDPWVRYEVTGYYKLHRRVTRRCEELSEQAQARQGKILL